MKLEDQVCSLDLAKRLKELGVKQESLFKWFGDGLMLSGYMLTDNTLGGRAPVSAAFTVAELGGMFEGRELPFHDRGEWKSYGYCDLVIDGAIARQRIVGDTEADARAAELAYLIEKKLIEV